MKIQRETVRKEERPVEVQNSPELPRLASGLWRDGLLIGGLLVVAVVGGVVLGKLTAPAIALRYVLVLGALTIIVAAYRLLRALPASGGSLPASARGWRGARPVEQFRNLVRYLRLSFLSAGDAHSRLGPIVREIVALRLLREHGVEMTGDAAQVKEVLGEGKIAELLQLERVFPGEAVQAAWTKQDLEKLVAELEKL